MLGLDLGTSGVKAVVTRPDGALLGRAVAGYPVSAPAPGRAESDSRDWWAATRRAVHAALADAGDPPPAVTGLAVAGQMHGLVLTDEAGAALRPAIVRLDQRAVAEAALFDELPPEYTAPLRNRPSPGMAGPLLCWLAGHEPNSLRCSSWALQPKDWLRLRLTGRAATDPTDASGTLLFDLPGGSWADPLIGKLGLPAGQLPPVRSSAAPAGRLLPGPAGELGLSPGLPVATGAGDTAAALHAAALGPGEALLTIGRDGQWMVPVAALPGETAQPAESAPGDGPASLGRPVSLYRSVGDGFYRLAAVPNAGVTLDCVRHRLGASWDELYATAGRPHRSGLRSGLGREELMGSALDAVAGLLRRRLDDLRATGHQPRRVVLGGAGAGQPAWRALLEGTLGLPLRPAPGLWLPAAGAARLAAAAAGY